MGAACGHANATASRGGACGGACGGLRLGRKAKPGLRTDQRRLDSVGLWGLLYVHVPYMCRIHRTAAPCPQVIRGTWQLSGRHTGDSYTGRRAGGRGSGAGARGP